MSATISSTGLSSSQHLTANKDNILNWIIQVEDCITGKGLKGYLTDGITRSILINSMVDPIGCGADRTGTANKCRESILETCIPQSDSRQSLIIQKMEDMLGKAMTDKDFKGNGWFPPLPNPPRLHLKYHYPCYHYKPSLELSTLSPSCKTWVKIGLRRARSRLELEGSYENRDRGRE
ncbi:hypothetical protein C8R41DRAFT_905817 [Lentinula lateritia]|uniref:Uncharacterized protein n=1 Tax=Lentinula lateritia TaxID=40482 RepID=A0ABQ8V7G7_9AGAR|nr:hypothetical protein C8R41DRAFT_905817 [Lentinula lateritia]